MDEQRQPLTRGRILDAAIAIIDRDGLNGLTMAGLGDSLDVTGMAIYKHFSSKEVLLVAARNALLAGIRTPPAEESWQERVRAVYLQLWALFKSHPGASALLNTRPPDDPGRRSEAGGITGILAEAGFGPQEARRLVTQLTAYALGFGGLVRDAYPLETPVGSPRGLTTTARGIDWAAASRDYALGLEKLLQPD